MRNELTKNNEIDRKKGLVYMNKRQKKACVKQRKKTKELNNKYHRFYKHKMDQKMKATQYIYHDNYLTPIAFFMLALADSLSLESE